MDTQIERQTDRQTDRQTYRQTGPILLPWPLTGEVEISRPHIIWGHFRGYMGDFLDPVIFRYCQICPLWPPGLPFGRISKSARGVIAALFFLNCCKKRRILPNCCRFLQCNSCKLQKSSLLIAASWILNQLLQKVLEYVLDQMLSLVLDQVLGQISGKVLVQRLGQDDTHLDTFRQSRKHCPRNSCTFL